MITINSITSKDLLTSLSKLADNECFHDVQLVCSDGVITWNRFLIASNSDFLAQCLSETSDWDEGCSSLILPDISSSTLSTLLRCTLDFGVRRDILSVNEQQVMTLLGFSLLQKKVKKSQPMPPISVPIKTHEVRLIVEQPVPSPEVTLQALDHATLDPLPDMPSLDAMDIPDDVAKEMDPDKGAKSFQCQECGHNFTRAMHLDQHLANHRRDKSFICDVCGKVFNHEASLKSHQRYHQDIVNKMPCSDCGKEFKGKRALHNHIMSEHKTTKCLHCDKVVPRSKLVHHLEESHGIKPSVSQKRLYCDICERSFASLRGLMLHKRSHDGFNGLLEPKKADMFRCELCRKLFANQKHLDTHQRTQHVEVECDVCGKLVKNVRLHQRNVHSPGKVNLNLSRTECAHPECDKSFATAYAAKYHFRAFHSSGDKVKVKAKQTCQICHKECNNLSRHMREVHSENRFECRLCGNFFPVKQSLERHLRFVHHGSRQVTQFQRVGNP